MWRGTDSCYQRRADQAARQVVAESYLPLTTHAQTPYSCQGEEVNPVVGPGRGTANLAR